MLRKFIFLRFVPALFLLGAGPLWGADWQSLSGNSPFGPAAVPLPAASDELEFRGVVQEEGVYHVNLYNPATKTSQWIPVNGRAPGLEIQAYDASTDKIQLTRAGRPLTLTLKQARVTLVQAVAPPPAAPNPENPADSGNADRRTEIRDQIRARLENGGDPAAVIRSLPPEAQAMIAEFRRRRAERSNNQRGNPTPAPQERQQP